MEPGRRWGRRRLGEKVEAAVAQEEEVARAGLNPCHQSWEGRRRQCDLGEEEGATVTWDARGSHGWRHFSLPAPAHPSLSMGDGR
jgi:hypothetical protein